MKTPTHREIAIACGVSCSTVSRALNYHRGIPESTRRRIVSAARRMGWRPNPLASAYMAHLRSTQPASFKSLLGFVINQPVSDDQPMPSHITRTIRGFERRAGEHGYQVRVFNMQDADYASPRLLDRAMFNRNIPGFAINAGNQPGKVLHGLNWSRYAVVAQSYAMVRPAMHRVSTNVSHGVRLLIDKAFAMRYRHVGLAVTRAYDTTANHGVLYPARYMQHNLKAGQQLDVLVCEDDGPEVVAQIATWLERTRPELVMGIWVSQAIDALGWRVPRDVAQITFDRSPEYPDHAGLDQRYEAVGSLMADVLMNEITHNRRGIPSNPVEHTLEGRWVDGPSAPRRRKTRKFRKSP